MATQIHNFMKPRATQLCDMRIDDLILRRSELLYLRAQMDACGRDNAAHAADEQALAISDELNDRLAMWLGNVPVAEFMEAL